MDQKKEEKKEPIPLTSGSFDNIDERMVVISSRVWLGLGALGLIVLAVLFWAFFGSITLSVEGRGISLTLGGVLNVPSKLNGRITDIYVKKGQIVKKDAPIARIYDYELKVNLSTSIERMNSLKKDLVEARKTAFIENEYRKEGIRKNIDAVKFSIKKREEQLPFLKKDLKAKNKLYKEGLVSASQREQAERNLMEENIRIEDLNAKISSLQAELEKSYKTDELKNYERLYLNAANDVKRLKAKDVHQVIKSPFNGQILEIQVVNGQEVKEDQSIAWLEKPGIKPKDLHFFCYVPANQGDKVKKGMSTTLQLFNVDPQKEGYLMGTVSDVSQYPVTMQHVFSIVQSKDLVEFLMQKQSALIEVLVDPILDPSSPSGYRWTSGKGPDMKIHPGLLCFVKIAIEKRKPISYVFPQWWLPEGKEQ